MNILIQKLCKKRLCLPSDIEFDDVSNSVQNNLCECGESHHIACVLKGKDRQ
jgi:hypothetical protein